IAIALMHASGDNFRLVFWIAVVPAVAAALVLLFGVKERVTPARRTGWRMQVADLKLFPAAFWWAVGIAGLLSLARFTPAFLVMKGHAIGIDAAFLPAILTVMHLSYAMTSYPFGVLADRVPRRRQLIFGAGVLVASDIVLATAESALAISLGAAAWGLQLAITQGLLAAAVADSAPARLRGTAFGILDVTNSLSVFAASSAAGLFWTFASPDWTFGFSATVGALAIVTLLSHRSTFGRS
ncbi:MAG TPA: MFS transporter, partial [Pseudolabrys sp.]|nr:MFS transporter [Pseudolabrys sp.]